MVKLSKINFDDIKIDWFGIGCVRCGSSFIWRELSKHPEIYTTKAKELHYFNNIRKRSCNRYKRNFKKNEENKLAGEYTPSYFYNKPAMRRINKFFPDAKLIISFRNPVERAFSNWKHATHFRRIPRMKFMESFEVERIKDQGIYADRLKFLYSIVDKSQVHIIWHDELLNDTQATWNELQNFLGIKQIECSTERYVFRYEREKNYIRREKNLNKQKPTPKEQAKWRKFYEKDIQKLEKITNKDLSHWRTPK